ncbi:MAG TPA: biotin--[acetyl-CoA-carboxylase] ligase [Allosphingosinicella sp.]|jgi:BirA family biotin operon repressor/biotin-[acetyl-CoA-carboxylase] ligase|nr:biotin--[acetyl-CoA-carboxylase] ligase [Allosphingosinicella sp.]
MSEIRTVFETGSTNDDVASLAREGAAEGVWLRAERQSGGRGRQGREWHSPPGNLHASTLVRLRPADPPAPTLALVAAVALHETASDFVAGGIPIEIKWPNDLLVAGAKLSGILLERIGDAVVVGFGVNLSDRPAETARPAIHLGMLGGAPDPGRFLDALAASFARWVARWRDEGLGPVRERWLAAAHPPGTALSTHTAGGARVEGVFDGLDETGALRLRLADGTARLIHAGDVFLI